MDTWTIERGVPQSTTSPYNFQQSLLDTINLSLLR